MSAEGEEMSRHTPGPWGLYDGGTIISTVGDAAKAIAVLAPLWPDQQKANAYLIAAAPDLLSAAKGALAYMSNALRCGPEGETCRRLRLAIAKAEGEAALRKARGV